MNHLFRGFLGISLVGATLAGCVVAPEPVVYRPPPPPVYYAPPPPRVYYAPPPPHVYYAPPRHHYHPPPPGVTVIIHAN